MIFNSSLVSPGLVNTGLANLSRFRPELLLAFKGWGIYFVFSCVYCYFYNFFLVSTATDFTEGVNWFSREWGVCALLTPVMFCVMTRIDITKTLDQRTRLVLLSAIIAGVLIITLGYRVGYHLYYTDDTIVSTLVLFFHQYLIATALLTVGWMQWLRSPASVTDSVPMSSEAVSSSSITPAKSNMAYDGSALDGDAGSNDRNGLENSLSRVDEQNVLPESTTLFVQKGQDECLVKIASIDAITAAGNYVDIYCGETHYLLRSSLKQLEARLPSDQFMRTHRSHIVRIDAVERIKMQSSGVGRVQLKNGQELALSKSYRRLVKQQLALPISA